MKNSNIQWIGEIPDDWEVSKLKYIFDYIHRGQTPNYVEKSNCKVVNQSTFSKFFFDRDNQKFTTDCRYNDNFIRKKDVLMASTGGGVLGKVFYYDLDYNDSIADSHVTILRATNKIESKFYYYTLSILFDWINNNLAEGSTNQTELQRDLLGNSFFPLPPLATQTLIATYLDAKCSEIDGLIADINKQIETLNELKKSTITEAVTKGLNKNAKLKDSGIQWIGMIPEGWKESRVKYVSSLFGRIGFRGYTQQDLVDEDNGAITLSPSNMKNMKMNYEKCSYISWFKYNESPEIKVENGDILFVKTGSTYGKSAYVSELPKEATINPQLIVFKQSIMDKKMLAYILQTSLISYQTELAVVGGTIPTMSQEKIKNFVLPLPPLTEQHAIATYLDSKCSEFDSIISDKQKQISTLEAYKKSLIYEYVTGKKEVEL